MVRERLDQFWIDQMYSLFENQPDLTDKEVAERLENLGNELGQNDYPALRTVNKYHRMYGPKKLREKAAYRLFAWPEEMGSSLLPWEASQASLELLGVVFSPEYVGYAELVSQYPYGRPTILMAHWFWRVTMAAPDMPARITDPDYDGEHACMAGGPDRFTAAQQLAAWEVLGKPKNSESVRQLEAYLAWRASPAHLKVPNEPPFPLGVELGAVGIKKARAVVAILRGAIAANDYEILRRHYPKAFDEMGNGEAE